MVRRRVPVQQTLDRDLLEQRMEATIQKIRQTAPLVKLAAPIIEQDSNDNLPTNLDSERTNKIVRRVVNLYSQASPSSTLTSITTPHLPKQPEYINIS